MTASVPTHVLTSTPPVPITEDDECLGGEGEGAEQTQDQGGRPAEQQPPRLRQDRGERSSTRIAKAVCVVCEQKRVKMLEP